VARIHDLIRQVAAQSPDLARDLEREVEVLSERRAFGLNFERHTPEEVELPGRPVRRGDKVHVLPPRGETPKAANAVMWVVEAIDRAAETATIGRVDPKGTVEPRDVALADLVVVAEFRDPIYPGLVSTGKVERGGDKPYHTVINAENFHALQTLLFTHRGKVDAIYIDPPYNTGARDWKYNNDYVESDDQYRHSKWLAFMERRLILAKELLKPDDSVLIVTIDEKEYLRLGLLLEQVFPESSIQMISAVISPSGQARKQAFRRTDEYIYFLTFGDAAPSSLTLGTEWKIVRDRRAETLRWAELLRSGTGATRAERPGLFYPVFVASDGSRVVSIGEPIPLGTSRDSITAPDGTVTIWPIRSDGSEGRWQISPGAVAEALRKGYLKLGKMTARGMSITYLKAGEQKKVESGEFPVVGRRPDGSVVIDSSKYSPVFVPGSQWRIGSHEAGGPGGSNLISALIPGRKFDFPKSLYAVEDALRFFIANKPSATVIDFFSGSGTTTHAVMRLNKQDGGVRQSICVTNNEVGADEQANLRKRGHRPGDPDWERWGICDYITKPRIEAAITGETPAGETIKGDYKFSDVFPMADGFAENVEFFTVTYEAPLRVASHRDFHKVAPLLWLRGGSTGRRIDSLDDGWDVADSYGVLADLDKSSEFVAAVAVTQDLRVAFVITDEDRLFEAIVRDLPDHIEPVRMYDAYLRNFEIESRVLR
jgi:adenine-specific DNA-methyltransferase